MMAESNLFIPPCTETENFTRLSMLVIDGGTKCLKDVVIQETFLYLLSEHKQKIRESVHLNKNQFRMLFPKDDSKPSLHTLDHTLLVFLVTEVLQLPGIQQNVGEYEARNILRNFLKSDGLNLILKGKKENMRQFNAEHHVVGEIQWNTLFPEVGNVPIDELDISLLCFIIFNAFDLRPSSGRYNIMPTDHQMTMADDSLRIKLHREALAHRSSTNIEFSSFESSWRDVSESLQRLGGTRYKNFATELRQNSVDTTPFKSIIKQYCTDTKEMKDAIAEVKENQVNLTTDIENKYNEIMNALEAATRHNRIEKMYLIKVHTGDVKWAGTDANVYLTIHGSKGRSSERKLSKSSTSRNKFERNTTDEFRLRVDIDLGEISKITVKHDNSGGCPDWYLDWVSIENTEADTPPLVFLCEKWLAKDRDDHVISRDLFVKGFQEQETNAPTKIRKRLSREESVICVEDLNSEAIPMTVEISYGFEGAKLSWEDIWICIKGSLKETERIYLHDLYLETHKHRSIATFVTSTADPGNVKAVQIGHDQDIKEIYLEALIIDFPTKGESFDFICKSWLGRESTDSDSPLMFKVQGAAMKYRAKALYNITITTANIQDAGTDTNIAMTLFGLQGKTTSCTLQKDMHRFERGKTDHLQLVLEDVGFLRKLRIETDGKGSRPTWHPEKIEVRNAAIPTATFIIRKWFSKEEKLTRDLSPLYGEEKGLISETTYKISVKTSDVHGAGTDSNVEIVMFGTNGDSGVIHLKNSETHKDPFERDKKDDFMVRDMLSLGDLCKVRVWHDDKGLGAAWHLWNIEVEDMNTNKLYTFHCDKWLSLSDDDKQICREITCGSPNIPPNKHSQVIYEVEFKVDPTEKPCGSDHVLTLNGEHGTCTQTVSTPQRTGDTYERMFLVYMTSVKPLGRIQTLTMSDTSWLEKDTQIKVTDGCTGERVTLQLSGSKGVFQAFSSHRSLMSIVRALQIVKYEITVHTGNQQSAGTDANVYIRLYGINGDTGERQLKKRRRDLFEKGQKDQFTIEAIELGELEKVRISHDDSGLGSGWFLDKIIVTETTSRVTTEFPCFDWLKKTSDDKIIYKFLVPLKRSLLRY